MKKITFSPTFHKKLTTLKKHDTKLFEKIEKQFHTFSLDPRHHSLRLHKLKGNLKNVWSISVTMDFRLIFIDNENYYFFEMGTHDEVYKR